MGIRCADHVTPLYLQKLALTSPTGGSHSVGILHSRTKATEFFFFYSTCFGRPSRPSTGVQKTVTAASGTGHSNSAKTFLQRGLIKPRRRKVFAPLLRPVPEAAVTVFCTSDDGRDGHPKYVE